MNRDPQAPWARMDTLAGATVLIHGREIVTAVLYDMRRRQTVATWTAAGYERYVNVRRVLWHERVQP